MAKRLWMNRPQKHSPVKVLVKNGIPRTYKGKKLKEKEDASGREKN